LVNGLDVGASWTRICIDSWTQAGYTVVSVNSTSESAAVQALYPDIQIAQVGRDGRHQVGRPLVYLSDMLQLAQSQCDGYFGIVNADVRFLPQAIPSLQGWMPSSGFVYSNRLDIDDIHFTNPRLHGGVDFLLLSTRDLLSFAHPDFLFGTPWWDYWLPLALNCTGTTGHRLTHSGLPVITHLLHTDQWSHDQFLTNFSTFNHAIADIVAQRSSLSEAVYTLDSSSALPGPMLKICLEYAKASSGFIHQQNTPLDIA
jgi:hypothetical protein